MLPPLLLLATALAAETTRDPGLVLEAGAFAGTPAVLNTGQVLGPVIAAWYERNWAFGLRARIGFADQSDLDWQLHHTEIRFSALAGRVWEIGRADVRIAIGAGAVVLDETRTHHQTQRLMTIGLASDSHASTVGLRTSLEAAMRLFIFGDWALLLEGGPELGWIERPSAGSGRRATFGVAGGLSIAFSFDARNRGDTE